MSLLFIDGFDHYATADFGKKGWNAGSAATISSTLGRRGGGCLRIGGSSGVLCSRTFAAANTVFVGMSFSHSSGGGGGGDQLFKLQDAASDQIQLHLNADKTLSVRRSTTVLGTTVVSLVTGTTYYIELKVTVHNTTGAYELRINGANVLSATNVDTQNTANATVNGLNIAFDAGLSTSGGTYDDLYLCDSAGSTNNNFLGDVRIDTLYPTADGTYSAFTPSTGSSHFALVDETAPNTSDYNEGTTVGDRDSYGMGNLAALASQTVYGVQVNAATLKDDAGAKSVANFVRSGSTNGDGASTALGTSQVYIRQIFETNPDGAVAWTETSVNAMEAGVLVTA